MKGKVLYISYDGMTDPLGQSQVLPYLTKLSARGYLITLMSFEKKSRLAAEGRIIEKICADAGITWVPQFFTTRPPILSKIYDRWNMFRKAGQLHRQHNFDIIHCRSYISAEVGLRLKKRTGVKFLFDMRGFWADERVDAGQWDLSKLFYRKLYNSYKKKERNFFLNADKTVSLTQAGKDYLLAKPEYRSLDIEVIPCCADLAHFDYNKIDPSDTSALRNSLGVKPGQKLISYLGSIGGWYMSDNMFGFFQRLLLKYPEFVMLILTKDDPERVKAEAALAGIPPDKLIVRYAQRKEVPLYISVSALSIFFIRPSFSKTASSPTKHAELMGMGVPVICNDIGDTGRIIRETGTGKIVREFSNEAYDEVVSELPTILSLDPQKIRAAAFRYFDLEQGANKYEKLYEAILATKP